MLDPQRGWTWDLCLSVGILHLISGLAPSSLLSAYIMEYHIIDAAPREGAEVRNGRYL